VVASGEVALRLAERLLRFSDADLASLRGVGGPGLLLVLGPRECLPWADGVAYLGRDVRAPSLLVSAILEPSVPVDVLERALLGRLARPALPIAVLLGPPRLVPTGTARPVDRETLASWLRAAV
jgi:hypothetical protein